jgi:hypothetical protein
LDTDAPFRNKLIEVNVQSGYGRQGFEGTDLPSMECPAGERESCWRELKMPVKGYKPEQIVLN